MRHLRFGLLLFALAVPVACALSSTSDKAKLSASLDENAADDAAFGKWDKDRQTKIVARCKATNVAPAACNRRLDGFEQTRNAVMQLLKKRTVSLELAIAIAGRDPDASLATPEPAPVTGRSVP